jgi:hypothetical protein
MAQFSHGEYDRLERAIAEGRRISVVRGGREIVVLPIRLSYSAGHEFLETRHPATGEELVFLLDDIDAIEIVRW